jgi:ATP synthase protein I
MPEPKPPDRLHPSTERMIREVDAKQKRIAQARARGGDVLNSIGIVGAVGWSVTVPTVLGVAAGLWLDRAWPVPFSWTLTLLIAGLAIGCVNAWLRIEKEQK